MIQAVTPDIVAQAARDITGAAPTAVIELQPSGTMRSFHVSGSTAMTVRIDEDAASTRAATEALVLRTLASATESVIAPSLVDSCVIHGRDGIGRTLVAYEWIEGTTLDAMSARSRARDIGTVYAMLHGARVLDLHQRIPGTPLTLMDSFRKTAEDLRAWMLAREGDGLGQDLLTLALSDLLRALRPFTIAQDHYFLTRRRSSLCHGSAAAENIVARAERAPLSPRICLVGFESAALGDAAADLALLTLSAALPDDAEDTLLASYLDGMEQQGRLDRLFVPRYFARRAVALLAIPVARLHRMARIKRGLTPTLTDPVVTLEEQSARAIEEIARAMNELRDLAGRARPVTAAEVAAMGRVVAIEELLLGGRSFRLAFTGQPYAGKTEVGSLVARRLKHAFFGTGAIGRALALVEDDEVIASAGEPPWARELVERLFARGFTMEPDAEPPFYRAFLDGTDVTDLLGKSAYPKRREPTDITDPGHMVASASASMPGSGEERRPRDLRVRGGQLLDDDAVRAAVRDALERRFPGEGLVLEGVYATQMLPGRLLAFHLVGDTGVRRARLMSHRHDIDTEEEATTLLQKLDAMQPPPHAGGERIDVGSRTAAAAALEILAHLLPPGRKPALDLSGRALL